ncbi:hypothetical protein [Nocardia otitidiscaviarum]|uniref:hypothetical protein n=1 Tax=Nocardia otitidiscaviarum TaxID=1823 RepID=UPI002454EF2D|nr:hypothetical protein [Nocardia otitidiscaviarum]
MVGRQDCSEPVADELFLSASNYAYWVRQTGATGGDAAAGALPHQVRAFKAGGGEEKRNHNHAGQLTVDEGYRAVYGSVGALKNIWKTDATTDVALGRRTHRFELGDWLWTTTLDDERDAVPYMPHPERGGRGALDVSDSPVAQCR